MLDIFAIPWRLASLTFATAPGANDASPATAARDIPGETRIHASWPEDVDEHKDQENLSMIGDPS